MESSVRDRFRLIYLKSAGSEKSAPNEPAPSPDLKDSVEGDSSPYHNGQGQKTFSSQTRLEQAKTDLKHRDPKVRILAIQFLENVEPSVAFPLLQDNLSDRNPEVRAQTILALIKQGTPGVTPLLRKYLKDSSPKVKIAALRGIFRYGEGIDLNLLLQLLSDESPQVRRKMATLLGWTQWGGALPILAELSKDPDAKVRKAALFSLVTLYPEESEERLMRAMTDSESHLRKWAKRALEKMAEKPPSVGRGTVPGAGRT
jgi:HEAT repeat protein